jgi:CheY-like chemotaxis protein
MDGPAEGEALEPRLETVAARYAEAFGTDLSALVERTAALRDPIVEAVEAADAAAHPGAVVHVPCRVADEPAARIHLLVARADAARLAALVAGEESEAEPAAAEEPLAPERLAAFTGVGKLAAAVLGRLLEEELGWPRLEAEAPREVAQPGADAAWLGGGPFARISYDLDLDSLPKCRFEVLVPRQAPEEDPAGARSRGPVVFVEPAEAEASRLRALEPELGRPVRILDAGRLGPAELEQLAGAAAVVVPWDLGGRSGLEWVETLSRAELTRDVPVLVADAAPTRGMVEAALRAGARSFLQRPYDPAEVRRRALGGAGEEDASPEPDR